MICEGIFLVAIILAPGSFGAVMMGGIIGPAGLVLSSIGIVTAR